MSPDALAELVAQRARELSLRHPRRIGIDGPPWSGLPLAATVADRLRAGGDTALVVDVADFLRPASVRLERGRDDPDAFYEEWVDVAALRREVLDPLAADGSRQILPTLWDAARDRATRAGYVDVPAQALVIVTGWFLLGAGLAFDLTIHVTLSPAARRRRIRPDDAARELPAYDRYDAEVRPVDVADIVVRADDPRRPAVVDRTG